MALTLKGNFKRGWPNPHIVEKIGQPDATCVLSSATPLQGFMGGHQDPTTGKFVLGITDPGQEVLIFRNGVDEADSGRASTIPNDYIQAGYGGIRGVSFANPILVETVQYAGTPAAGNEIYCDTDGKWKVAVSTKVVVARVDEGVHPYQGQNYITLRPVAPYVKA